MWDQQRCGVHQLWEFQWQGCDQWDLPGWTQPTKPETEKVMLDPNLPNQRQNKPSRIQATQTKDWKSTQEKNEMCQDPTYPNQRQKNQAGPKQPNQRLKFSVKKHTGNKMRSARLDPTNQTRDRKKQYPWLSQALIGWNLGPIIICLPISVWYKVLNKTESETCVFR